MTDPSSPALEELRTRADELDARDPLAAFVDEFVPVVDLEGKRITVRPPEFAE